MVPPTVVPPREVNTPSKARLCVASLPASAVVILIAAAAPPVPAPAGVAPPDVVMFATAMGPSTVEIFTCPPAPPVPAPEWATPVVTRLPTRLIVPVPVAAMVMEPEATPLSAVPWVVVMLPAASRSTKVAAVRETLPALVVTVLLRSMVLVVILKLVPAPVSATAPLSMVVPVPATCVRLAALMAAAVTLFALLMVIAPSGEPVPTAPVKVTLPVPAVRPSASAAVPFRVLLNRMLPAPAPVFTRTLPVRVVAET